MGVWIEIALQIAAAFGVKVAPFVGVWIEMYKKTRVFHLFYVAPFVGVWIEMQYDQKRMDWKKGRSLRGSVD